MDEKETVVKKYVINEDNYIAESEKVLNFGVTAICLAYLLPPIALPVTIVFAIIALVKAIRYKKASVSNNSDSKTGFILSIIALVKIVFTTIFTTIPVLLVILQTILSSILMLIIWLLPTISRFLA